MDATHDTNHLKWYLSTFMVRDEHKSWIPAAFFLYDRQDARIISESLLHIKGWTSLYCQRRWQPRYFLTDDSAAEQAAVQRAFPGLIAGEMEVDHLLCVVHSERTLRRRFGKYSTYTQVPVRNVTMEKCPY